MGTSQYLSTTISAGATKAAVVNIDNGIPVGIYTDPAMSSTSFTFLAGNSKSNCTSRLNDGSTGGAYTVTFTAGDYVPLSPTVMAGVKHLIAIGNSSETNGANLSVVAVY